MTRELILPRPLPAVVHMLCRGYAQPALQRENGRVFQVGEDSDYNFHLRRAVEILPVFHELKSLQPRRRKR